MPHFKAFGILNFQLEIRICHRTHNKGTVSQWQIQVTNFLNGTDVKTKGEKKSLFFIPFLFSDRLCRRCYSSHDLKFLTGFELGSEVAISRSPASTASIASGQGDQTLCSQTTQDPSCTCGLFLWTWFQFRGDFRYVYFFEIESKKIIDQVSTYIEARTFSFYSMHSSYTDC